MAMLWYPVLKSNDIIKAPDESKSTLFGVCPKAVRKQIVGSLHAVVLYSVLFDLTELILK